MGQKDCEGKTDCVKEGDMKRTAAAAATIIRQYIKNDWLLSIHIFSLAISGV